eukprot:COSAG02_NODE_6695_length_3418_cov_1.764086_1_plen_85_part_10
MALILLLYGSVVFVCFYNGSTWWVDVPKKKKKVAEVSEAKPPPSARKGTVKVGGKNTGNTRMRNHSSLVKETVEDQAEFFLRKFN